jgi:misacylated tRNA(Ala) deacylase
MEALFRDNAYLKSCEATVLSADERGIRLDRTVFYATSGGQPGDAGKLVFSNGSEIVIASTVTGDTKSDIIHVPAGGSTLPEIGYTVKAEIDWNRRLKLMQMHTACHILSVVCPFPITGAAVGDEESRVDFDAPDLTYTREHVTAAMQALIDTNHPVTSRWIDEAELDANPGIVKSKNVRPPRGLGRIRLVLIGENGSVDSQPCGGTHVATTGEIGLIHIGKIENKGRENRRFRIRFGAMPEAS